LFFGRDKEKDMSWMDFTGSSLCVMCMKVIPLLKVVFFFKNFLPVTILKSKNTNTAAGFLRR